MLLEPGQKVLDRYLVQDRLGAGGMGEVFRGVHERLDMPVALKVLTVEANAEYLKRFEQEARMMAQVRHPNVVSILDFGLIEEKLPCIAMELVEGAPLSTSTCGAKPWREAVQILLDVLAGLSAIHDANFLHRDLKPSNILVCPGDPDVAKLIDFGISKSMSADVTQLTKTGLLIGTPAYMPPEQLLGSPLDERSDLYTATLVLYEMATGGPAFIGSNYLLDRIVKMPPMAHAPTGMEPLPAALQDAIAAGLALDPDDRPENVRDMASLLRPLLAETPPAPAAPAPANLRATDSPAPAEPIPDVPPTELVAGPAPTERGFEAPPLQADARKRYVVVARVPPSRLADAAERRWLASLTRPSGRGYSLGSQYWFALHTAPSEEQATTGARTAAAALEERYGSLGKVAWRLVGEDFALSPAHLTGVEPFPPELQDMLDEVA